MITLQEISSYLPYKLKCSYIDTFGYDQIGILTSVDTDYGIGIDHCYDKDYIPILRPLSDFTKEIEIEGKMIQLRYWVKRKCNDELRIDPVVNIETWRNISFVNNLLLSLHFDIFGLIERGDAVDINALK